MNKWLVFICWMVATLCRVNGQLTEFPEYFKFGSASAAYQVEGAWDQDGKGENIWDRLVHSHPQYIKNGSTANDAAKSYMFYKDDVQLLKNAGMNFYRFSISWARVMPTGDPSIVNELGLQYYDNLINELLDNGIEPMVTLYHWDLPQGLQDLGGMVNPIFPQYFEAYADLMFKRYGDRVKTWVTFNEPIMICDSGYGGGGSASRIPLSGTGVYLCAHHVLIAHARAYRLYKSKYERPDGKVGIVVNCNFSYARNKDNPDDVAAAERRMLFYCGLFTNPIFSKEGGYPAIVIENVDRRSKAEGRAWSRLPVMDESTKELIRGTADFFGLNYYSSSIGFPGNYTGLSFFNDQEVQLAHDENWPVAKSTWLRSIPDGLRQMLNWIKNHYDGVETIITENGWSDDGELEDTGRITYLRHHLQATLDAINDGCYVTGHTTWSIMDNFEWLQGYNERFGIYHVDFTDPNRKRTAKNSVNFLKNVIQTRRLPPLPA